MNGINYVFDTNALIYFLQGNPHLSSFTSFKSIAISILTILEFRSFKEIGEADKKLLADLLKKIEVIDLKKDDIDLIEDIIDIRTNYKIKLPDAIIAATALYKNAVLVTNDQNFSKIPALRKLNY